MGSGIYLSQERLDSSFAIKELASSTSTPTAVSISRMKKLIGYLKSTEGQRVKIPFPCAYCRTDADWSGHKGHRTSTSSSVHAVNGCVVFEMRGQKVVSLSQSELHALVGGACDGWSIRSEMMSQISDRRRSPTFLLDGEFSSETDQVQTRKWKVEARQ